jgi:hypothetical protein
MWFRRRNGCRMSVETRFTISANVPEGLYDWLEVARGGVPHLPGDLDARREQPGLGGVLGLDRRGR